ncbi:hypothetical protein CONPUDRAFT_68665 [Coniophora puteana RWD-64-598 SS2]|uniref:FAD/NAD(P)-binding domain-containing protein n=1 Tax=Coniophora puteana (strain RWD-64-598) TaxID=741705 RepID=A0A5M3N3Q1_CONPW|nr:uncharacterized protein CONPUDRAFT_68665 [Coniophora puteana RWD-64-598 SS2]EIW86049.1 hypothetical protein CONPUDRAFT_68665 [Coniophora puteana RWD-64-598 SS2]
MKAAWWGEQREGPGGERVERGPGEGLEEGLRTCLLSGQSPANLPMGETGQAGHSHHRAQGEGATCGWAAQLLHIISHLPMLPSLWTASRLPPSSGISVLPPWVNLYLAARDIVASWKTLDGATGRTTFDYVIDASGRAGILSTQYLKNCKLNNSLKNVARWAYWEGDGIGKHSPGATREGSPFFEAFSVGHVIDQEISNKKAELCSAADPSVTEGLLGHYLTELKLAPRILDPIADGKLIASKNGAATVRSASDYSYLGLSYAGAFIGPYFSSGIRLTLSIGLSAAATINASIKDDIFETDTAEWHTAKVGTGYMHFLFVVWSAYQQIRSQSVPVLSDADEDNFDCAFAHFRPVIRDNADVGKDMSESELQVTIEFCMQGYVESPNPEERAVVKACVGDLKLEEAVKALYGNLSAVKNASVKWRGWQWNAIMEGLDEREKRIAVGMTARKVMRSEDTEHIDNFIKDELNGYRIKLVQGSLGLEQA